MSSENNLSGIPIVLSGPSGVGKTTIRRQILSRYQDIGHSVSATTRGKRSGEVHGKDYFFLSRDEFQDGIDNDRFMEWSEVHGEYYGTPKGPVEECLGKGTDVLLVIDIQGGVTVKQMYPESLLIFLLPPSMEALLTRLQKRGHASAEDAELRLQNAHKEVAFSKFYDYWVINHQLEEAVSQVRSIIVADRCRAGRARDRYLQLGYDWPGIGPDTST